MKNLSDFSSIIEPLGAVLNLEESESGAAIVGNKPDRVKEVCLDIETILAANKLTQKAMTRLRGRLLFARALCHGRSGGAALRALSQAGLTSSCSVSDVPGLGQALGQLARHLQSSPPRIISWLPPKGPTIFTDGAFEPGEGFPRASFGAVLIESFEHAPRFFPL